MSMDASLLNQFVGQFLVESDELISRIEAVALSMGDESNGKELVHEVFRAFHTLKGNAGMFGFNDVAGFTHHIETMLDKAQLGDFAVTSQFSDLILNAADHIKVLLQAAQGGEPPDPAAQEALLTKVHQFPGLSAEPATGIWQIEFRPAPSLFAQGVEPVILFDDLKQLGECSVTAHTEEIPLLEELDPSLNHLWWTIELRSAASESAIRDVFLFISGEKELKVERAVLKPVTASRDFGRTADAEPEARHMNIRPEASLRVSSEKLDHLVNLVGELVMNQSRLATAASRFQAPELASAVEEIDRLVAALRDDVLQIRMMPIGSIFARFKRLVHDLSREMGKDIRLVTEGEETGLDKSVLDQLTEPLVHLVRNSADHGIEDKADRLAKGKPGHGTIRLSAVHRGADVVVSIEDDGAGMNRDAIRAMAISKKLIAPEAMLSDKEILNLILLPGFSTAAAVTSVSGRGVGMDVVTRQVDSLHGTLTLGSEYGMGSCVSLTLPLTLAIIDGLLVESGDSQYIIPMAAVTENVELLRKARLDNNGRNLVAVRGQLIPYIDLREAFGMVRMGPEISKIVLVHHESHRVGLVVDRVIGTHQTVIQALGSFYRKIDVVSGATVMGDGRVALILDIAGIVRLATRQSDDFSAAGFHGTDELAAA